MFSRWGALVYRFRRAVAILTVVLALASTALAAQASASLSSGGWLDADSESADVAARLDTEFGAGKSSVIALFRADAPDADARSAAFQGRDRDRACQVSPGTRSSRGSSGTPRRATTGSSAPRATPPMS